MARKKQRKMILKWQEDGEDKGVALEVHFSDDDQEVGATALQLIDIAIRELKNLKLTGTPRPVLVHLDNLRDTFIDDNEPSAES